MENRSFYRILSQPDNDRLPDCNLQIDDSINLITAERLIEDNFIQTIEELRTEVCLQHGINLSAGCISNLTGMINSVKNCG